MEVEHRTSCVGAGGEESPPDSCSPPSLASSFKTGQPYYMGYDQNEEAYGEGPVYTSYCV